MINKLDDQNQDSEMIQAKEKVNIYLSSEIVEKIEELVFYFRKQLPPEKRKRLNKSKLYELILEHACAEFSANGQQGILGEIIQKWNKSINN